MAGDARQFPGDLSGRKHKIRGAELSAGAARHVGVLGAFLILRECDAAFGFNGCQAERSIGAGAGKHHSDGLAFAVLARASGKKHRSPCRADPRLGLASRRKTRHAPWPEWRWARSRRCDWPATGVSPRTSATGIFVTLESSSLNMLLYVLLRWDTRTNAMPVSLGRACSSSRNASRPPAEAPMPTTGTGWGSAVGTAFPTGGFIALLVDFPRGIFFGMGLRDELLGYSIKRPNRPSWETGR